MRVEWRPSLIGVEADRRSILSDLRDILKKAGTDNAIPFEAIRPLNEFQQGTSRKHGIITNSRIDAHLDAIRSWRVGTDQELRELAAKYVKLVKSKKRRKLIGNQMSALAQRAKHLKQLNRALLVCKKNLVVDEISPAARGSVLGLRARREDEAVCGAAVMLQDGVPEYLREAEVIILDGTGVKERYAKRFRCDANGRRIECEGPKRRFKIGERVLHQGPTYRVKAGRQFTCVEAEAQVPREGYYLKQYVSKSYSKTKLIGGPEDQEETKRELEELARIIRIEAERLRGTRKHGCVVDGQTIDVLVVCQKPVEDQLRKLRGQLRIPSNVALRHFNKIRGTNDFKDVPCAIIVGRAKEGEAGAEDKAEALAVDDPSVIAIERLGKRNWIAAKEARKGTRRLPMTDGRIASVPCEWHPDANVRAAMSIAGEEVLQAANRIRAFDRSADNPCTVLYYGQHYSGLEAHEVLSAVDGRVDALDLMLARGVVYRGREAIRRAHKGWLPEGGRGNREAALIERRIEYLLRVAATSCDEIRHGQVNSYPCLIKNILMSDGYKLAGWKIVTFTLPGRAYPDTALVDLSRHPDAQAIVRRDMGRGVKFVRDGRAAKRTKNNGAEVGKQLVISKRYAAEPEPPAPARSYPAGLVRILAESGVSLATLVMTACSSVPPETALLNDATPTEQCDEIRPKAGPERNEAIFKQRNSGVRRGRPRKWATAAERQKAYLKRKRLNEDASSAA